MADFVDPFSEQKQPELYSPQEAYDSLNTGENAVVIVPQNMMGIDDFFESVIAKTSAESFSDDTFVGAWHGQMFVMSAMPKDVLDESAEENGLSVGDVGPIAVYDEDDKEHFPVQEDNTYVLANETKVDEELRDE